MNRLVDLSSLRSVMDIPDGVPKWSGHKGDSELLQEMDENEGYVVPLQEPYLKIYGMITMLPTPPAHCPNTKASRMRTPKRRRKTKPSRRSECQHAYNN